MSDQPTDSSDVPTAYALATSIAKHMTGPARWSARRRDTCDEEGKRFAELLRLDDGAELGVTVGGYRQETRVTFRAHWPKYADGSQYSPREYLSITCDARRDPKALARDVERRLLAEYDPAHKRALEEIRASDAAAGLAWAAAERIAVAVGAELPRERPRNSATVELHGGPEHIYRLKVHPAWGDHPIHVSFEVHDLDESAALGVLEILARHPRTT